ncbi:VPDSG-CTERM sorting domain-containing protein [Pelagicoccus sp. NFK12]|uniref:VPDSG-CTERM sorting domain-containing protein n=1 Tax=Pelagicoccus enzymogenes TaxID=2773457 RepID=A0A927F681_9BACT|nr:VPDSG-CTERM sorting domain-containing protein [Pelagicoccus enzymogenes]MBD5779183.1 VPDSG-CTERM sorting domain-containing protein [Pelagicoccus enzymogenes]MDQ8198465.1 VPDSG-CTERM sorting domain-containing protein [Pelagicoccus enzymogenes]
MPFVLDNSTATLSDVNPQSDFYKLDAPSSESGSGAGIFDFLFGVDNQLGEFVQLTWAGNPKPFLTGIGLKAGSSGSAAGGLFAMLWDASDLQLFNNSSSYDAIRIYQDGIVHKRNGQFLGISHVTVDGEPGQADVKVPDSGSAFAMLGVGIAIILVLRRRMKEGV